MADPDNTTVPPDPEETTQRGISDAARHSLRFVHSEDRKRVFSDFFQTRLVNGALIIDFSRISHDPGPFLFGNILISECEVALTWTQLKMLATMLAGSVESIEAEIGPIPIPRNFSYNREAGRATVRSLGIAPPATYDADQEPTATPPASGE